MMVLVQVTAPRHEARIRQLYRAPRVRSSSRSAFRAHGNSRAPRLDNQKDVLRQSTRAMPIPPRCAGRHHGKPMVHQDHRPRRRCRDCIPAGPARGAAGGNQPLGANTGRPRHLEQHHQQGRSRCSPSTARHTYLTDPIPAGEVSGPHRQGRRRRSTIRLHAVLDHAAAQHPDRGAGDESTRNSGATALRTTSRMVPKSGCRFRE